MVVATLLQLESSFIAAFWGKTRRDIQQGAMALKWVGLGELLERNNLL